MKQPKIFSCVKRARGGDLYVALTKKKFHYEFLNLNTMFFKRMLESPKGGLMPFLERANEKEGSGTKQICS